MTFQQKLMALLNFSVTEVLPVTVKSPATQAAVLPYIGLGVGAIALLETLFSHTPIATTPSTAPTTVTTTVTPGA